MRLSMPAHVGFSRRQILLAGKEQGHIHWHAGEDTLLDRRYAFVSTRNLDEQVRAFAASIKLFRLADRLRRVMSEQRRDFHRYPSVDAIGPIVNRSEEIGCIPQVLQSKFEEERLARLALLHLLADGVVVEVRVLNRMIEDRGI